MSEELNQSANTVEVAEPQEQVQVQSENTSEVAEPKPVQDAETNAHYAEQRRKQELDQYRSQAETYQQQLDRVARTAGYQSHDDLMKAIDEHEQQQQRQQYEEAGLNPDALNKFLEEHPDIQYAKQLKAKEEQDRQLNQQWTELSQEFPNLEIKDIPDEVWIMHEQGKPLLDAYLRHNYKNLGQQKEQEAIQKLQQNQSSSPGALGQEGSEHKTSYSQLSASEKAKLRERVLRGEATSIF